MPAGHMIGRPKLWWSTRDRRARWTGCSLHTIHECHGRSGALRGKTAFVSSTQSCETFSFAHRQKDSTR